VEHDDGQVAQMALQVTGEVGVVVLEGGVDETHPIDAPALACALGGADAVSGAVPSIVTVSGPVHGCPLGCW
jgi:hypothetical protein